jgi:molybdopterin synthase catalytic subunit
VNIQAQFYGQLRDFAGASHLNVEVSSSATVAELLENIYQVKPSLRVHDKSILVGAGLEFVGRDYPLREGEQIAIMPPVQGG